MIVIKGLVDTIQKLSNQELNEVSVREEIVNPLLKLLGYESAKHNIQREAKFKKLDVFIGSKKDTTYQADYYFETFNHKKWILEVKKSSYKIDDKAFRQALSYAIHPSVNAELFAICNGRKFVLYSVRTRDKILDFDLIKLRENYSLLFDFLSYRTFDDTTEFSKDFGLYLKSKNYTENDIFEFCISRVQYIDVVDENTIYINTPVIYDDMRFFASFKIDKKLFISAHKFFADIMRIKKVYPFGIPLYDNELSIYFRCKLTHQITEAQKELYLPLVVVAFIHVELMY